MRSRCRSLGGDRALLCLIGAAASEHPGSGAGVYGIGLGLAYAALTSVIVQSVPPSQTGTAIGMNANIRTIGGRSAPR